MGLGSQRISLDTRKAPLVGGAFLEVRCLNALLEERYGTVADGVDGADDLEVTGFLQIA